jgi:hypothetical protein
MQNISKEAARAELQKLMGHTKELERIINTPEASPSLLERPTRHGEVYWSIQTDYTRTRNLVVFSAVATETEMEHGFYKTSGNFFQTYHHAVAYTNAIETWLRLHHMPGTEPLAKHKMQSQVLPTFDGKSVYVGASSTSNEKLGHISPCFDSKKAAQHAIDTLSSVSLVEMFAVFAGRVTTK